MFLVGIFSFIFIPYLSPESFETTSTALMNDTVLSYGATTNSANQLQTEFVSSTSSLVGKSIDIITVNLKKFGSPTGTVQVGVFNTDLSVKQIFGTMDAFNLTSSQVPYSFSLSNQTYVFQTGDRIGVKYTGGSSSNYVDVGVDQTNSFDGTNSYLSYYTSSWSTSLGKDLTMILESSTPSASTPPSPPTALSANAVSSSQISLSWATSSNNGGSPITGYKIERESPIGAGFSTLVANTDSTSTTYTDSGLTANTVYNYRVSAINSIGTSTVSNNASSITLSSSGPTVTASPPGGTYSSSQSVTLTSSSPGTIFYTTNGTTPTTSSPSGTSPVTGIIVTTNSTLKFFAKDNLGNTGSVGSEQYIIKIPTTTVVMNDTVLSYGATTNSANPLQTEFASSTSSLVGKSIDTIVVDLKKFGLPTGSIQIGIFNDDLSVKQLFGTQNASSLSSSLKPYSFSLLNQTYAIQSGDRIGIKFAGGDSSNFVDIGIDQTNSFDGTNSYLSYFTTSLQKSTAKDVTMTLKSNATPSGPTVTASPPGGTYSSSQSVTLTSSSPGTIFYTTNGTTPTTSSPSGTSPVTGIIVTTNSTLKFFAKDNLGNTGPTTSAIYVITTLPLPTVSASPPAGTYSSAQSVTLSTSVPSIIFYTTDGTTPTTSSASGSSPVIGIIVSNSTLKFFAKDGSGNTGPIGSSQYVIKIPTNIIAMNDTVLSYGATTNSANQLQAEFVSSTSSLVGKSVSNMIVNLKKIGTPTGAVQIGVFNTDLSVKLFFGTINASSLSSSLIPYSFSLPMNQTYIIQSGDRIGIKFAGGDSSNFVDIGIDQTNSFDGTNSYLSYYTTSWNASTGKDLTMTLKSTSGINASSPIITLKGSNPLTIGSGSIFIDPGATAFDTQDGNLTSSIVKVNSVNSASVGSYTITYDVSDSSGNAAQQVTRTVNVISSAPIISMADLNTANSFHIASDQPIVAEYVSSGSSLVGKSIDTIIATLRMQGSPTGIVQAGIFNTDLSVKQLFSSMDVTNIFGPYAQYTFSMPPFQTYKIQAGDRIGIKFTGGNPSNALSISVDTSNGFDGGNSFLTSYPGHWSTSTGYDVSLILEQAVIPTDLPIVKPPVNILSATTNSSRNIPNLGASQAFDKNDPSVVATNNSPGAFPVGDTNVIWHATNSKGNIGAAYQKITVISASPPANQFNKVAMINFDDGFASVFVFGKPILDKYNIKTTQYVICGRVGGNDYMTWNMVHSLQADGHDIQAHTMNHLNSNKMSQSQLDYEYGRDIPCLTNNGTTGVHVVAIPFNAGYNNKTVINTIAKYFDFARGFDSSNEITFFLHCNGPLSTQTDCRTFDSTGKLNKFTRYDMPNWSSDTSINASRYNDAVSFASFIHEINKATTNTATTSTEIPVVYYHRIVQNNTAIPNFSLRGTTTELFDAEMKYLVDNNFKIRTTKDLTYNTSTNLFSFTTP